MNNRNKDRIQSFFRDPNKKSAIQILYEAFHFSLVKKELPSFYFGKLLYRKGIKNYTEYLCSREVDRLSKSKTLHTYNYTSLFTNKIAFAQFMKGKNLNCPETFAYNLKNKFFIEDDRMEIGSFNDFKSFINQLFEIRAINKVFIKTWDGTSGKGCFLIAKNNFLEDCKKAYDYVVTHDCIFQECIVQHKEINRIYSGSVNTIRFNTYVDRKDNIHILSAFMRFGNGSQVVDNTGKGGFFLNVDVEKGELKGHTLQQIKYGGLCTDRHPLTGIIFDGFKIPMFEESKELVIKATDLIKDRMIGWDIAITPVGPTIVEGNGNNSFVTADMAYGGFLKHPLFKEILEDA